MLMRAWGERGWGITFLSWHWIQEDSLLSLPERRYLHRPSSAKSSWLSSSNTNRRLWAETACRHSVSILQNAASPVILLAVGITHCSLENPTHGVELSFHSSCRTQDCERILGVKALGQHSCHERLSFGMAMARASCVSDGLLTNGHQWGETQDRRAWEVHWRIFMSSFLDTWRQFPEI